MEEEEAEAEVVGRTSTRLEAPEQFPDEVPMISRSFESSSLIVPVPREQSKKVIIKGKIVPYETFPYPLMRTHGYKS